MTRPLRLAYPGACYPVTCRGNARQAIRCDDPDGQAFVNRLGLAVETHQVRLHCYVLMTNYFHLVVETPPRQPVRLYAPVQSLVSRLFQSRPWPGASVYQGRFKFEDLPRVREARV